MFRSAMDVVRELTASVLCVEQVCAYRLFVPRLQQMRRMPQAFHRFFDELLTINLHRVAMTSVFCMTRTQTRQSMTCQPVNRSRVQFAASA